MLRVVLLCVFDKVEDQSIECGRVVHVEVVSARRNRLKANAPLGSVVRVRVRVRVRANAPLGSVVGSVGDVVGVGCVGGERG